MPIFVSRSFKPLDPFGLLKTGGDPQAVGQAGMPAMRPGQPGTDSGAFGIGTRDARPTDADAPGIGIHGSSAAQPAAAQGSDAARPPVIKANAPTPAKPPSAPSKDDMADYIRRRAPEYGIDPDTALTVARKEGLNDLTSPDDGFRSKVGNEPSFGPFQLLVGGEGTGYGPGLGNAFKESTGLDPSDPSTVFAQIDFALNRARENGWSEWYGASAAGLDRWSGIDRDQGETRRRIDDDGDAPNRPNKGEPASALARIEYTNQKATRNRPLQPQLERTIAQAVGLVYGPGHTVKVYSGGQTGSRRTGSYRHDDGLAADVHIYRPDGTQVTGNELAPLGQYWAARRLGGVGLEMRGGGIHLDLHAKPRAGHGMHWNYAAQGGTYTPEMADAMKRGLQGELPQLVSDNPMFAAMGEASDRWKDEEGGKGPVTVDHTYRPQDPMGLYGDGPNPIKQSVGMGVPDAELPTPQDRPVRMADLRPLDMAAGEYIENGDGSVSTGTVLTVPDGQGGFINVPTLFMGPEGIVDLSEQPDALQATATHLAEQGTQFDRFDTEQAAETAAEAANADQQRYQLMTQEEWAAYQAEQADGEGTFLSESAKAAAAGTLSATATSLKGVAGAGVRRPEDETAAAALIADMQRVGEMDDAAWGEFQRRALDSISGWRGMDLIIRAKAVRDGRMTPDEALDGLDLDRLLGNLLENQRLYQAGERVQDFSDEYLAAAKGWEESWTRKIGEAFGSTVPFLATAPLGVGGSFAAGTLMGSFMSSGEAIDRAIAAGASREQVIEALRLGRFPGLTEQIPIEVLFERVPLPAAGKLATAIGKVLTQAAVEGGQEAVQQAAQNLISKFVYDPDADLLEGVAEAAGIGAIVGGGLSAGVQTGQATADALRGQPDLAADRQPSTEEPPSPDQPSEERPSPPVPPGQTVDTPPQGPLRRAAEVGARRMASDVERRAADLGLAPNTSVRIDIPGTDPFMGRIESIEATGEAIVMDTGTGEILQVPFENMTPLPVRSAEGTAPAPSDGQRIDEMFRERGIDPENRSAANIATETEKAAAPEQSAAPELSQPRDIGSPPGTAQPVVTPEQPDEPDQPLPLPEAREVGPPPGAQSGEAAAPLTPEGRSPAPQNTPETAPADVQQVPSAVPVSGGRTGLTLPATTNNAPDSSVGSGGPVPGETAATETETRRVAGDRETRFPDRSTARLFDLGNRLRLGGASSLSNERIAQITNDSRQEIARELGIRADRVNDLARDYYRRAAAAARRDADAPALNPKLLERYRAEAQTDPQQDLDAAANQAATSPTNALPEPSDAQKEAGNYKVGRVRIGGFDVSIENPAGSVRSGTGPDGTRWETTMQSHYGYFRGTVGRDKDHIDTFIKPGTQALTDDSPLFVVDQVNEDGSLDEHKVMTGFGDVDEARAAYLANYDDGWQGLGDITETTVAEFRDWTENGNTSQRFARRSQPQASADDEIVSTRLAASGPWDFNDTYPLPDVDQYRRIDAEGRGMLDFDDGRFDAVQVGGVLEETMQDMVIRRLDIAEAGRQIEDLDAGRTKLGRRDPEQVKRQLRRSIDEDKRALDDLIASIADVWPDAAVRAISAETERRADRESKTTARSVRKRKDERPTEADRKPRRDRPKRSPLPPATPEGVDQAETVQANASGPPVEERTTAPSAQDDRFAGNKIFTADRVEAARARLKDKMGRLNSGIDPELLVDGMTIAGAYIEAGIRDFSRYAKQMTDDLGEQVKPYLLSFWEGARNYPGLDTQGMTGAEESARLFADLTSDGLPASEAQAVGAEVARPKRRTRKRGRPEDRTLTDDWGVEHIDAYSEEGEQVKAAFLKESMSYLRATADILSEAGFQPAIGRNGKQTKPVSKNEAGIAVSGDVSLHMQDPETGQHVYAHISGGSLRGVVPTTSSGIQLMYRAGTRSLGADGTNQWAPTTLTAGELAAGIRRLASDVSPATAPKLPGAQAAPSRPAAGSASSTDVTEQSDLFDSPPDDAETSAPDGWAVTFDGETRTTGGADHLKATQAELAEVEAIIREVSGLDQVTYVDTIQLADGAPGWGSSGFTTAAGFYLPSADTITLALDSVTPRAAYHEAFHRLQHLFLTDRERKLLRDDVGKLRRIVRATPGREGIAGRMSQKEVEAEAFAVYAAGAAKTKPYKAIAAVWDQLARLIDRTRNWLAGKGWQTIEDVFETAASGAMANRAAPQGAGQTEYAISSPRAVRMQGVPAAAAPINRFANDRPLKAHPDYRDAKAGDRAAALRLADDLIDDQMLAKAASLGSDTIYVPVQAEEQTGRNQIPRMMAEVLAHHAQADTDVEIVQANRARHTGAKPMERIMVRPEFVGAVEPRRYVIVDDVSVMASTIAELANHIQANGGEVAAVATLVNASREGLFVPKRQDINKLTERFGDYLTQNLGIAPGALTADEARYILGFRSADELGNRLAKARRERSQRLGEGAAQFSLPDGPQDARGRITQNRVVDWLRGKLTDLKPAMLGAIPLNYFPELRRPNMTAVDDYLRVKRSMDAFRGDRHAEADALAQEWFKYARLRRDGKSRARELATLMHDSTLAGIDPSKRKAAETDQASYDALRKRYDALPRAGQELFRAVRDAYEAQQTELDDILIDNVRKIHEIAQKRAEEEYQREVDAIERNSKLSDRQRKERLELAAMRHSGASSRAQMSRKARLTRLRIALESSRVTPPYFPLSRFGKYFVTVKDVDGEVLSFSRRESAYERDRLARQMEKAYPNAEVAVGVLEENASLRDQMDPRLVAEIEQIVGGAGMDSSTMADITDQIWQRYLSTMPDLSIRKRFIHRKGTAGFSEDALRNFSSHMFHASHQMARLKYGMELQELVNDIAAQAKKADDPTRGVILSNEMRKRHDWVMNPTGTRAAQFANSTAFVWYLGVTPAAAAVNLTQTPMLGVPILGARFGSMAKAGTAILRASKDSVAGRGLPSRSNLAAHEKEAMEAFYSSGLIDRTQSHDLAGVGDTGVQYSPLRARVMGPIAWLFHSAEVVNREVTALAAYRMAKDAGQRQQDAIDTAHELVFRTHFDYSNASRPRYLQNDWMKVLMVFRSHQINMLYRLLRDAHQTFKGETPAARREARRQLIGILGMQALFAGVSGIAGFNLAMSVAGMVFGDDDDPMDFETHVRDDIIDMLGPELGGILLNGAPGHYLGVNLTNRIGMPDLWFRSPTRDLEGREVFDHYFFDFAGASVSMLGDGFRGFALASDGDIARGIEAAAPKFVTDVMKTWRYAQEGVVDTRHNEVVPPEHLDTFDLVMQFSGFTPATVKEAWERRSVLKNAESRIMDKRRKLIGAYALAHRLGDDDGKREALERIKAFNEVDIHKPLAITPDTLRRSIKTRARNARKREDGALIQNDRLGKALRDKLPERVY